MYTLFFFLKSAITAIIFRKSFLLQQRDCGGVYITSDVIWIER